MITEQIDEEARKQGRHVAQWVIGHFLQPIDEGPTVDLSK